MSISRWEPWRDVASLRDEIDRLFRESWVRPAWLPLAASRLDVAIDLRETDSAYVVEATIAGVKAEDLTVNVAGETLRIIGEAKEAREEAGEAGNWLTRERRYGRVERTITLPSPVWAEHAEASIEDGVLTITLPKAAATASHTIPVHSGKSTLVTATH